MSPLGRIIAIGVALVAVGALAIYDLTPTRLDRGIAAFKAQDYEEAARLLTLLANRDVPWALYYVAEMHRRGYGTEKDKALGLRLHERAGNLGLAESQDILGQFLMLPPTSLDQAEGDETEIRKHTRVAFAWYLKAAKQGVPYAYNMMFRRYCDEYYDSWDPVRAGAWQILYNEIYGLTEHDIIELDRGTWNSEMCDVMGIPPPEHAESARRMAETLREELVLPSVDWIRKRYDVITHDEFRRGRRPADD